MAGIARYDKIGRRMKDIPIPVCEVCGNEMSNVNTTNGVRRFQCMTRNCEGQFKVINMEAQKNGARPRHQQKSGSGSRENGRTSLKSN